MKIKFYTYVDKRPDFIELQYKALRHFVKDDFELIIFNNCPFYHFLRMRKIYTECKKLNIKCINIKRKNHLNPALACAEPIQWSFHHIIKQDKDISCIIDSDMFLINPLSVEEYLKGYDIAAVKQIRGQIKYLWNGLMFFDLRTLPNKDSMNFMCGKVENENVDVGGFLYYWLRKNLKLKIKNIHHTSHIYSGNNNLNCLPKEIRDRYEENFCFEIYDKLFLHYGRGSNWDKMDKNYHQRKTDLLRFFVNQRIQDKITLPNYNFIFDPDCWGKQKNQ